MLGRLCVPMAAMNKCLARSNKSRTLPARRESAASRPEGDAGASGATIVGWKIDHERYVATPVMSDGRDGPPLELRGLFEQFFLEAR